MVSARTEGKHGDVGCFEASLPKRAPKALAFFVLFVISV